MVKVLIIATITIAAVLLSYSLYQHREVVNSESYKFAKLQIEQNPELFISSYGIITTMELGLFDYSIDKTRNYSSATYKIKIKGTEKIGIVVMSLVKEGDRWEVKQFEIHGSSNLPIWLEWLS